MNSIWGWRYPWCAGSGKPPASSCKDKQGVALKWRFPFTPWRFQEKSYSKCKYHTWIHRNVLRFVFFCKTKMKEKKQVDSFWFLLEFVFCSFKKELFRQHRGGELAIRVSEHIDLSIAWSTEYRRPLRTTGRFNGLSHKTWRCLILR